MRTSFLVTPSSGARRWSFVTLLLSFRRSLTIRTPPLSSFFLVGVLVGFSCSSRFNPPPPSHATPFSSSSGRQHDALLVKAFAYLPVPVAPFFSRWVVYFLFSPPNVEHLFTTYGDALFPSISSFLFFWERDEGAPWLFRGWRGSFPQLDAYTTFPHPPHKNGDWNRVLCDASPFFPPPNQAGRPPGSNSRRFFLGEPSDGPRHTHFPFCRRKNSSSIFLLV